MAGNGEPYDPPTSLWSMIVSQIPDHEIEEVKNLLGESLIEQSLELHEEISALLEIWRDYREGSCSQTLLHPRLPEPPAVRDLLMDEIKFFVKNIQEKARNIGRNPDQVLSQHNSRVLDYVLDQTKDTGLHQKTSSDGRESSFCRTPLPTDRSGRISALDNLKSMDGKLNVFKLDEIVIHFREILEEEIETLLQDIQYLQECLESEVDTSSQASFVPSLSDLRKERTQLDQLERELSSVSTSSVLSFTDHCPKPPTEKRKVSAARQMSGKNNHPPLRAVHPASPIERLQSPKSAESSTSLQLEKSKEVLSGSTVSMKMIELNLNNSEADVRSTSSSCSSHSGQRNASPLSPTPPQSRPALGKLLQLAAPSHVKINTGTLAQKSKKLIRVGTVAAPSLSNDPPKFVTIAPSTKPSLERSSAAQRFRSMVLECREVK